jgi:signal transduction histidine kinase
VRLPRVLRTASFRLAALYVLLFGGSVVVLGAVVLLNTRAALERQMKAQIQAELAALLGVYRTGGLERLEAEVSERGRGNRALDYLVQASDGRRLAGDLPSPGGRLGWVVLQTEPDGSGDGDDDDTREWARVAALDGGGLLAVGDSQGHIEEVAEAILGAFGWALGLTVLLGVVGGLVLSAGFLRRIDAITRTAEAIVSGDLAQRVPERGTDDDLDRLAHTLNHMLDRIGELMEGLRQVSSAVAHELRTPLTRLRQRLESARSGARSVAEYAAAVDGAVVETDAVLQTFAALLRIAQIEAGTRRAAFRDVDLGLVAERVVEAFAPAAEDEGKALAASVVPGAQVRGDHELLTQLLANLVDNAIRHTPAGTRIAVSVARVPAGARLVVADDGPGVPAGERDLVVRRFHRLERSRATHGAGLGLSLVVAVADLHQARMVLDDNAPGLRVTLDFSDGRPPPPTGRHQPEVAA